MKFSQLFNVRMSPANTGSTSSYASGIEALRGLCALWVMITHAWSMDIMNEAYNVPAPFNYLGVAGLAIFLFFVISGYVIGMNYRDTGSFSSSVFYKKRAVRLYPIYLICLILIFLSIGPAPVLQLLSNLFILQNDNIGEPLLDVLPLFSTTWSLHYEVIYYLLFPLILYYKPRVWVLLSFFGLVALAGFYSDLFPMFISDYSVGYLFWLSGLCLAWMTSQRQRNSPAPLISLAFLVMAYWRLSPGELILNFLNLESPNTVVNSHGLGIQSLFFLPLCIIVIAEMANLSFAWYHVLKWIVYLLPLGILIYFLIAGRMLEHIRWIIAAGFYIVSLVFLKERYISSALSKWLEKAGGISYGIYIFHMVVAHIVTRFFPIEGSVLAYWLKFMVWILMVFGLSYLTEKVMQKHIRKLFFSGSY